MKLMRALAAGSILLGAVAVAKAATCLPRMAFACENLQTGCENQPCSNCDNINQSPTRCAGGAITRYSPAGSGILYNWDTATNSTDFCGDKQAYHPDPGVSTNCRCVNGVCTSPGYGGHWENSGEKCPGATVSQKCIENFAG